MTTEVSKLLGRVMPRRAYSSMQRAMAAFEAKRYPQPTVPRLSPEHLAGARLLPSRTELLRELPRGGRVAELGVNRGDFSAEILRESAPERLHLVDMWASGRYGDPERDHVLERFAAEREGGRVQVHLGPSTERVGDFADGYFDWVYIDTGHGYALTRDELRAYAPKVKPGGYLAGHDYIPGNWAGRVRYGVIEAAHEFCVEYGWAVAFLTMEYPEHPSFALRRL